MESDIFACVRELRENKYELTKQRKERTINDVEMTMKYLSIMRASAHESNPSRIQHKIIFQT